MGLVSDPMSWQPFQKLTAWLCLAGTLTLGVAPEQGWVLCLEPGGGIALERASEANRCAGCPEDAGDDGGVAVAAAETCGCPCVDIPLVLEGKQDRFALKRVELPVQDFAAIPAAVAVAPFEPVLEAGLRARAEAPRPVQALALIRSVVLLV